MKHFLLSISLLLSSMSLQAQQGLAPFENLLNQQDTFLRGDSSHNLFSSGAFHFYADTTAYGTWTGWTISSMTDSSTGDFTNQFSVYTAAGHNHSDVYAVAYNNPKIGFETRQSVTGMWISNSTYAYKTMKNGNPFAKKFGGADGNDADSFVVRAYGYNGGSVVDSTDFYLADYTFQDNAEDYLVDEFRWWDLSSLGEIDSMTFEFFSSDVGQFGINTPTYFCMDQFNGIAPDTELQAAYFDDFDFGTDSFDNGSAGHDGFYFNGAHFSNNYNEQFGSWSGFALSRVENKYSGGFTNQYAAITGSDFRGTAENHYMVANGFSEMLIELPYRAEGHTLSQVAITNAAYAYYSMRDGDDFAKKFGGEDGTDPDFFLLQIVGYNAAGNVTDTIDFYLADYRFEDSSQDYIIDYWQIVRLNELGAVTKIKFLLSSSDNGSFGMNTPAYFCLDAFNNVISIGQEEFNESALSLYPNPSSDFVQIVADGTENGDYFIYSHQGQLVSSGKYHGQKINIQELSEGQYFFRLQSKQKQYVSSFIKL